MLLVHIEGFLEVARLNGGSRAAESLYVTQPTLTARLHALERELGERLFIRARHGMRLTEAGRAFMPYAERAVRALREGRRAIEELESGSAGQLQVAAAPAVSTYILPAILESFVTAHPRVEVAVRTGHSEDVLRMVLSDQAQIGLGRALLPRTAITRELGAGELSRVEIGDGSPMRRSIVAMRRRDAGEPTGVVAAFLDLLTVHAAS